MFLLSTILPNISNTFTSIDAVLSVEVTSNWNALLYGFGYAFTANGTWAVLATDDPANGADPDNVSYNGKPISAEKVDDLTLNIT